MAYAEGQIVAQFDDSIAGSSAKLTHRYLWGSAVDQILAEETHIKQGNNNPTWSQPGTTFWPMTDHLGTIRDWGQVYGYAAAYGAPAQRTQVVKHREYDSFGNIVTETNRADFNNDGKINAVDIDLLAVAVNAGSTNLLYDLNGDGLVNANQAGVNDLEELVLVILNTYFGNANLDGQATKTIRMIWSRSLPAENTRTPSSITAPGPKVSEEWGGWKKIGFWMNSPKLRMSISKCDIGYIIQEKKNNIPFRFDFCEMAFRATGTTARTSGH